MNISQGAQMCCGVQIHTPIFPFFCIALFCVPGSFHYNRNQKYWSAPIQEYMKATARLFGLLAGVILLIAIAPPIASSQTPLGENVFARVPDAISITDPIRNGSGEQVQLSPTATPQVSGAPVPLTTPTIAISPTLASRPLSRSRVRPAITTSPALDGLSLLIHLPPNAQERQPLRLVIALHGMGGHGTDFAQALLAETDRDGWVVVAPTIPYNEDYMNPARLIEEDVHYSDLLANLVGSMPQRLGLKLRQHALLYGFSRGAQLAHRFALLHPEYVETVATISAGSYTMPEEKAKTASGLQVLPFPYGIGDLESRIGRPVDWENLRRVSFWIAVGDKDNRVGDVSRAFDPYCGNTRIERARAFDKALKSTGVDSTLVIFANVDHEITAEMRKDALDFLHKDEAGDNWDD